MRYIYIYFFTLSIIFWINWRFRPHNFYISFVQTGPFEIDSAENAQKMDFHYYVLVNDLVCNISENGQKS